jgi:SAM-dependent methyltransferase
MPDLTHWDRVYRARTPERLTWHEASPAVSLRLLDRHHAQPGDALIDVGGGASRLAAALVARGWTDLTVLDISAAALDAARTALGGVAINWIVADITQWQPQRRYTVWHDRAAFHFMTTPEARAAYGAVLRQALAPDGLVIIGTFALDGPETCSGLPVERHDAASLAAVLGPGFTLLAAETHDHRTPAGASQRFHFAVFRRRAEMA